MGIFLNKRGEIPEIPSNLMEDNSINNLNEERNIQEFPVLNKNFEEKGQMPPKAIPEIINEPRPQLSKKMPSLNKEERNTFKPSFNISPSITTELSINNSQSKIDQPFFVRIDKFNETVENFRKIFEQVNHIEKIVESLELTKEEEEKEIEEWKRDILEMKNNLNKIDSEIFNKI